MRRDALSVRLPKKRRDPGSNVGTTLSVRLPVEENVATRAERSAQRHACCCVSKVYSCARTIQTFEFDGRRPSGSRSEFSFPKAPMGFFFELWMLLWVSPGAVPLRGSNSVDGGFPVPERSP